MRKGFLAIQVAAAVFAVQGVIVLTAGAADMGPG